MSATLATGQPWDAAEAEEDEAPEQEPRIDLMLVPAEDLEQAELF